MWMTIFVIMNRFQEVWSVVVSVFLYLKKDKKNVIILIDALTITTWRHNYNKDKETSKIQAVITHRGIYKYRVNHLAQCIKTTSAEFNRILSQILKILQKTEAYFYDIIIHWATREECHSNLRACLVRLQESDLYVNADKWLFFVTNIQYLGHVIELNKIQVTRTHLSSKRNVIQSNIE